MRLALSLALIAVLLCSSLLYAATQKDLEEHTSCNFCGMTRTKFAHSRMLIKYDDGSEIGTCSLHCAACALRLSTNLTAKSIETGDFSSKQLIDAKHAFWVLGGTKPGIMTDRAKWAFAERSAAETFIERNGGELVSFSIALQAAQEDLFKDALKTKKLCKERNIQP